MKRIVEFVAMVGNHNLYSGEKLVIDWNNLLPIGKEAGDIVALCIDKDSGLAWVETATEEEIEKELSNYLPL
jgi:hypothetical protein